jgi:serine protease
MSLVSRLWVNALMFLAAVGGTATSVAQPAGIEGIQVVPGEYLVRLVDGRTSDQLLDELKQVSPDVKLLDEIAARRLVRILIPGSAAQARSAASPARSGDDYILAASSIARGIAALPSVEGLEPVMVLRLTASASNDIARVDESMGDALKRVNFAHLAHLSAAAPVKPIVVAVIDSGVMLRHEILKGLILDGKDISGAGHSAQATPLPNGGIERHGTATAGMIAAVIRGGTINGSPRGNVRILPIRATLADDTTIATPDAIKAIDYAITQNARIVNAGWSKAWMSAELQRALADADAAHMIVVTAAGNGRRRNPDDPADPAVGHDIDAGPNLYPPSWQLPNLIVVAALGPDDSLATFSNWGRRSVHLAAPGESILVPTPLLQGDSARSGYQAQSGTSIATAIVTGSIALFEAAHPTMDHRSTVARVLRAVTTHPALRDLLASGGVLSVASLFGDTAPAVPSAADSPAGGGSSQPHFNWRHYSWLMKAPRSAGPIATEAPVLRGYDAAGSIQ